MTLSLDAHESITGGYRYFPQKQYESVYEMIEILSIKDEMIKFCSLSHIHLIYSSICRLMNVLLLIARKHEF